MAWGSEEARHRLFAILLENINRFAAGQPQNVVV
jgi:glycerate dehydrogenase